MTMVLEFPFKIFLLILVVLVLITMMWQFRDRIMSWCLFPPCEERRECDVQTMISEEVRFTQLVLDKYCGLCWIKNGGGTCQQNSICYVLNLENDFVPGTWDSKYDYCIVTCDNAVSFLYVQYQYLEGTVEIVC